MRFARIPCPVCLTDEIHAGLRCLSCGHTLQLAPLSAKDQVRADVRKPARSILPYVDKRKAVGTAWQGRAGRPPSATLTPHEQQVVALLRQGMTQTEIAKQLGVKRPSVMSCVKRACDRVGAESSFELVRGVTV